MLKLAFATILVFSGLAALGPAHAEANGNSGIGRGCTLDPFTKTMRCIDFDNCTKDKNGRQVCPVVVTPYGKLSASAEKGKSGGKGASSDYLVVTLKEAFVSSF